MVLAPLNLCHATLDGIRNHSWSRPTPATAEGEVVAWADRIAYVCHDFEDAVSAGIIDSTALPVQVRHAGGARRSGQINRFVAGVIAASIRSGVVAMDAADAEALAAFRAFNYEHLYLRPASVAQANIVITMLRALVEYFSTHPDRLAQAPDDDRGSAQVVQAAVAHVAGMTDRFACQQAVIHLDWSAAQLPRGLDLAP